MAVALTTASRPRSLKMDIDFDPQNTFWDSVKTWYTGCPKTSFTPPKLMPNFLTTQRFETRIGTFIKGILKYCVT